MATKVIQPKSFIRSRAEYSQGILAEGGKLLLAPDRPRPTKTATVVGKGRLAAQTRRFSRTCAPCWKKPAVARNLVNTTTYITDRKYREDYNKVRMQQYKKNSPTSTLVIITGLAHPDYLIEINGIAVL